MEENKKKNPFDSQIEDINEQQKNAFNPGYYVGSGKVPPSTRNLFKSPITLLAVGLILFLPTIYNLFSERGIYNIIPSISMFIISGGLIIGGVMRLKGKK